MTLRLLLVDDHELLAGTLAAALAVRGLEIVRPPSLEADAVLAAADEAEPDIVLLDLWLEGGDTTLDLIAPLSGRGARVVMVTGETDRILHARCVEAGAIGIVAKSEPFDALVACVIGVAEGRALLSAADRSALLAELREHRRVEAERRAPFETLTPREAAVLGELVEGRSAEVIAQASFVSIATVRAQIRSILSKLGVSSQLAAVSMARRAGWEP